MTPEFSRIVRVHDLGAAGRDGRFEANPAERAALARRFGLESLDALAATLSWRREAAGVKVEGELAASGAQLCAVSGEPAPFALTATVNLRFVAETPKGDEIELAAEELDTLLFDGDALDLGEAVAEELALALDPYPRAPGAKADGVVISEDEARERASPFAVLRK